MRLARLLHSTVSLLAAGHSFDSGVLKSIEAASSTIIGGNRDATDAELLGLENLIDQLIVGPSEEAEVPVDEAPSGGSGPLSPEPSEPSGEVQVPSDSAWQPEDQIAPVAGAESSGVDAPEAGGGVEPPSEPESVTAVAPPEAAPAAPAELLDEPPVTPKDELFAPQSNGEDDDGA